MTFNADDFMQANFTEAASTKGIQIPPGDYLGTIIDNVGADREWETIHAKSGVTAKMQDSGEEKNIHWMFMKVPFKITAPHEPKADGRTVPMTVFMDVFQDEDDEVRSGAQPAGKPNLAEGKNVALGRLREAISQNEAGVPWNPKMMVGSQAVVKVEYRKDNKDPNREYAEIKQIAAYTGEVAA